MKFSTLLTAASFSFVLAQTSSDLVNQDIAIVKQGIEELRNSPASKEFKSKMDEIRNKIDDEKTILEGDAAYQTFKDAQKSLFDSVMRNNITRSTMEGLRNGSITTSGNAEVDGQYKKVSEQKASLSKTNPTFASLENNLQEMYKARKEHQVALEKDPLFQKLQADRQKLEADAAANNITLPDQGMRMRGPPPGEGSEKPAPENPTAPEDASSLKLEAGPDRPLESPALTASVSSSFALIFVAAFAALAF